MTNLLLVVVQFLMSDPVSGVYKGEFIGTGSISFITRTGLGKVMKIKNPQKTQLSGRMAGYDDLFVG